MREARLRNARLRITDHKLDELDHQDRTRWHTVLGSLCLSVQHLNAHLPSHLCITHQSLHQTRCSGSGYVWERCMSWGYNQQQPFEASGWVVAQKRANVQKTHKKSAASSHTHTPPRHETLIYETWHDDIGSGNTSALRRRIHCKRKGRVVYLRVLCNVCGGWLCVRSHNQSRAW